MRSIQWTSHAVHIVGLVGEMFKNSELTDGVLDTEGGLIHIHKTMLGACSPYLKNLFKAHDDIKVIPLKEVDYKDMKLILDLICFGKIHVPATDVGSLRQSAELLQISSWQWTCENFSEKISTKDVDVGSIGRSGTNCRHKNLVEHKENVTHALESRCISEAKRGYDARSQNIDVESVSDVETKRTSNARSRSELIMEDEVENSFTNSRVKMQMASDSEGDIDEDELRPITFVAVSPVWVKSEEPKYQESESDPLLQNPLEVHPDDSNTIQLRSVEEETGCESKSQTRMEIKREMEVSEFGSKTAESDSNIKEATEKSCDAGVIAVGNGIEQSCDKSTTTTKEEEDNGVQSNRNGTCNRTDSSVCPEICVSERTEDIQVKSESIFVPDVKEEVFVSLMEMKDDDADPGSHATALSPLGLQEAPVPLSKTRFSSEVDAVAD